MIHIMEVILIVTAITTGLTQIIKNPLGSRFERWGQLSSLVIAVVLGVLVGLTVVEGLMAGLASQGLFDTTKFGVKKIRRLN